MGESSFVEIGVGTFEGCFGNIAGKVSLMMSRNGESSFVEMGMGTFGGCFINKARMPGRFSS